MRIALMVSGNLMYYRNGVNTFIESLKEMLSTNHCVDIILSDINPFSPNYQTDPEITPNTIAEYYRRRTHDISSQPADQQRIYELKNWSMPSMERALGAYLATNTPDIVIANDIVSMAVLVSASESNTSHARNFYYGHFPDDIYKVSPDQTDIDPLVLEFHQGNLRRAGRCTFMSSTITAVKAYEQFGTALYAPMPCPRYFKSSSPKSKTVWINSGNYPRKRKELMIKIAEAAGLKVVSADGVSGFEAILMGAVNCAVMLHLSSNEIMPYAILEACGAMHVVMASDAEWANELPITNYSKIETANIPAAAKQLKRIVDKAASFPADDMIAYNSEVEAIWREILS